jgi:hypothetical protein
MAERLTQLKELFPEAFVEGRIEWDRLRLALGDAVDERPERYTFGWAGKRDAIRLLQTPGHATLLEVFRRTSNREAALRAPDEFAATAVRILRDRLADQLVDGIRYEPIGEEYRMQQWEMEVEAFEHYLLPSPKGVYDHVAVDTLARDPRESVEGRFVDEMERDDRVRLYVKLPRWFIVPTPLGSYNPDWALVLEERDEFGDPRDTLYLVAETKGTTRRIFLRISGAKFSAVLATSALSSLASRVPCGAWNTGSLRACAT